MTMTVATVDIEANARRDALSDITCCGKMITLRAAWAKMEELARGTTAEACARYRRAYVDAVLEVL